MQLIKDFLANVRVVGGKQCHQNMTLFLLLMSDAGEPGYRVLEEALSKGAVGITGISHGGSVSELKLINKSPQCVLVVDGEESMGAKQRRVGLSHSWAKASSTVVPSAIPTERQGRPFPLWEN